MAIFFVKAVGAEITAISKNLKKRELANKIGANSHIALEEENFSKKYEDSCDIIIKNASSSSETSMNELLNLLTAYDQMIFETGPLDTEKNRTVFIELLAPSISVGGFAYGSTKYIELHLECCLGEQYKTMD